MQRWLLASELICLLLTACQSRVTVKPTLDMSATTSGGVSEMLQIELSSPAFENNSVIPRRYTCQGEDLSPQLDWTGVPSQARSLALIVDDPDAPGNTWLHWLLFDLPPDLAGLPENAIGIGTGGLNDFGKNTYGGPCPPKGKVHHYYFRLYALDSTLGLNTGAARSDVEAAMQGHIIAQGHLVGIYSR